jgi:FAD binding domain-containing protein/berberine-like enzyme
VGRRLHGTAASRGTIDAEGLARRLQGDLLRPGDPGYGPATRLWNGMISKHPGLVARCAGTRDVAAAVSFARDNQLPLAIRGGGHGVAGQALCDNGLVIDLAGMTGISVDAKGRTVRAQGGCTLGDVDQATQAYGLATPLGVVTKTGIAGLTLSGGMGWLRRKYGLSCDNLIGAEIVTAAGEVLRADAGENADLFWAIRGGGGNFGVVTSFDYRLYPVGPEVFFCYVLFPVDRAVEVLRAAEQFVAAEPSGFAPIAVLGRVPAVPEFPPDAHGQPFVALLGMYPDDPGAGERVLAPLRSIAPPIGDLSGRMAYTQAQSVLDEDYPDGWYYYWKSVNLPQLSDDVIDRLVAAAAAAPCPRSTIDVWFQGGAMARADGTGSAFGNREVPYLIGVEGNSEQRAGADASVAWVRNVIAGLRQYSTGGVYLNFAGFLEEGEDLTREGLASYDRLVEVKTRYDPANIFRFNANIRPRG